MRLVCKRNGKVILKQAFWVVILAQLSVLCFLAVTFRDASSRALFHSNVISPLLSHIDQRRASLEQSFNVLLMDGEDKEDNSQWKFKDFDVATWNETQKIKLHYTSSELYFRAISSGQRCFIEGTDFRASVGKCFCLPEYFGLDCGIPAAVWYGHFQARPRDRKKLAQRDIPRRLVHGVLVNHEFDFFEARVRILQDVVDAFIVQESNFTTFGTAKELEFLKRFKEGWLPDQQDKFIYVMLSHFKEKGKENGWYADAYIRMFLSKKGLPMIEGIKDDDLFLLLDADELPSREVLLFLKLYDGYTEPIRFGFRWTVFGFFWLKQEDPSILAEMPLLGKLLPNPGERLLQLYVACTMGMLKKVYGNNAMLLRRNVWDDVILKPRVQNYTKLEGHKIKAWEAGTLGHYAGYHCSWCYKPEGIRTKLMSAQKHDKPRWGDYPEKTNVTYIANLIRTGSWFDDTKPFIAVKDHQQKYYAPKFFWENKEKFGYLLEGPDSDIDEMKVS